jgi:capsule polysaccharide export protein KpsE/RkpR
MKNPKLQKVLAAILLAGMFLFCLVLIGFVASYEYVSVDSFVMTSASESGRFTEAVHLILQFVSYSL